MRTLLLPFAGIYLLSAMAMFLAGQRPVIPWTFVFILAAIVPIAYCVMSGGDLLGRLDQPRRVWLPVACLAVGVAIVQFYPIWFHPVICLSLLIFSLWQLLRSESSLRSTFIWGLILLCLGYGTVWNLNYLFAQSSLDRLHDSSILAVEECLYACVTAHPPELGAFFPVCRSACLYSLLENSYLMLFPEVLLVVLLLGRDPKSLVLFLQVLFSAHLLALLVFLAYPVAGPYIYYYPDLYCPLYEQSQASELMRQMRDEYAALRAQSPLHGICYFVSLPSMHVATAVLFQIFLRSSRVHFWLLLPANCLMAASTFLLGFHYIVDSLAGVVLALIVYLPFRYAALPRRTVGNTLQLPLFDRRARRAPIVPLEQ